MGFLGKIPYGKNKVVKIFSLAEALMYVRVKNIPIEMDNSEVVNIFKIMVKYLQLNTHVLKMMNVST